MRFKLPRPRISIRGLSIAIAGMAVVLWAGLEFWSPTRRMGKLLRADQPLYVRKEAAASLGRGIPSWEVDRALDLLLAALDDPSPVIREYASVSLSELGARAHPAVPKVIGLLKDENRNVRFSMALALGSIGVDPEHRGEAVTALLRALNDPDPVNRVAAAKTLVKFGEAEKVARVLVTAQLGEKYPGDWAGSIVRGAVDRRPFIAALAGEMRSKDEVRREKAYQAILLIAEPETIRMALDSVLADSNPEVRRWAASHREKLESEPSP